ncbi:DUF3488 and transglutaminase-like domain-containing protein [Teredinibacter sp. KSP-S5-2]|uniref:transglutaminase family protein n=1 Tax=Teredinibacter sp. KSP-S5-2 TaxID=3034506 RepID=UPI002934F8EE|nr:DUF3488 and transglutaminase-like domain-containing protein [Teredinibacter sp. KSP-S5-2]WNO10995.1 DUF3488 and transglutaminase-like domain-containing protein [Teredinibacter sp. KSP-S5-2]
MKSEADLTRFQLIWLLIAQALAIFPLFFYLPKWLPVIWFTTLAWRVQVYRGVWPYPASIIKTGVAFGCLGLLLLSYGFRVNVGSMSTLLCFAFVLKLMEVRKQNDLYLVIFVAFITLPLLFLFSTNVLAGAYVAFCFVFIMACLTAVQHNRHKRFMFPAWVNIKVIFQALPIMVLLFVIMPRLNPLWNMPSLQKNASTGFSDSMSPGSFSELIKSSDIAFRVTFDTNRHGDIAVPPKSEWYWRGLVLDHYEANQWTPFHRGWMNREKVFGADRPPDEWELEALNQLREYRYSILLEPHNYRWLFSMRVPFSADTGIGEVTFTENYLVKSPVRVNRRIEYSVTSSPDYSLAKYTLSNRDVGINTQLPDDGNPKARELAASWRRQNLSSFDAVQAALSFFQSSFTYTINPPPLGMDSVDEFLFDTQKGFCEHFAGSFVFLMRAYGIPARVVVGYQGGELTQSGYLIVRQSDAHAWAEVWLAGEGWVRVDPTASVSPLRIDQGFTETLSGADASMYWGGGFSRLYYSLQKNLDLFNYHWHRWVIEYEDKEQQKFLSRLLGGVDAWRIAVFLLGVSGCLSVIYLWWGGVRAKKKYAYPVDKHYQVFLAKLSSVANGSLKIEKGDTPTVIADKAVQVFPYHQRLIRDITHLYTEICYAGKAELLPKLHESVRQFKVLHLKL